MGLHSKHLLSNKIIKQAKDEWPDDIVIDKLARLLGINTVRLWYYLNNRRKWTVESWLASLAALGMVEITDDRIIIHGKVPKGYRTKFKDIEDQFGQ